MTKSTAVYPMIPAEQWEIEAALLLSWTAYDSHNDGAGSTNTQKPERSSGSGEETSEKAKPRPSPRSSSPKQRFLDKFTVAGEICTFCTSGTGQKYLVALVERDDEVIMFVSFAGTHLPGDWETINVDLRLVSDSDVGAPSHAGFLRRALEIPLEGLERIASRSGASRIVFVGHSLGGAVAHLCRLRWLHNYVGIDSGILSKKESVVSIAFGAPFFGGDSMLTNIKRHGWLDGFITIVNGNDPVPRIMNLAAALVDNTLKCAFSTLFSACVGFIIKSHNPVGLITDASSNLVAEIQQAVSKNNESPALEDSFVSYYVPIGMYIFYPFAHVVDEDENSSGCSIEVEMSRDMVLSSLGPINLLGDNPGFVTGFLNYEGMAHHDIQAYWNIFISNRDEMHKLVEAIRPQQSHSSTYNKLHASDLEPRVSEMSCECLTIHESQPCRVLKFNGENLDFVGDTSITIDPNGSDTLWSRKCVVESTITRRSATDLVLEQQLDGKMPGTTLEDLAIPSKDIMITLRSDAVIGGDGGVAIEAKLPRAKCHAPGNIVNDPLSFYGGQFFLDTQRHAWLCSHLFGDDELVGVLREFGVQARDSHFVENPSFLMVSSEWNTIEDVGSAENLEVGKDPVQLRDELYEKIVPPNGLEVRTKKQGHMATAVAVSTVVIGGGIVLTGGLGIIGGLIGSGGSLTGGYGTATLVSTSGSIASFFMFRNRFEEKYSAMLHDLVRVYTGHIPKTGTEFRMEELLLREEASFVEKLENGMLANAKVPTFDQYNEQSQKQFRRLVKMIRNIHKMKVLRMRSKIVAICGPRDSGKTTLLSQLLQDPKIAARGSGYTGGADETTEVKPYSIEKAAGYAFLDTPGLTGPNEGLRKKFSDVALSLSSTFVYIREYHGLPTEVDIRILEQIFKCAARGKEPNILVCLNRCKEKLTEDAAGEIFHLRAETEQQRWLSSLEELSNRSNLPTWVQKLWKESVIQVSFVELKGDKNLEGQFDEDERTRGIWTASSIGRWIAEKTVGSDCDISEASDQFRFVMNSFEYKKWQKGYRAEVDLIAKEKREMDSAMEST